MRLRTIVFAVLGVLVVAVAGIAVALATLDFGRFKGPIAAQVAQATGRELVFGGPVSLTLWPSPSLTASEVTLANAPGGSRPHMLRLGSMSAQVELWPLLFERTLHVTRLSARDADLLLEIDAQGRPNWDIAAPPATPGSSAAAPAPDGGVQTGSGGLPLINRIDLSNISVTWRDARPGGATQAVLVKDMRVTATPAGRFAVQAAGEFRGQQVAITAELDRPTGFIAPGGPFAGTAEITLPGTVARLEGGLADARAGRGLDVTVAVTADTLAALAPLVGATLPAVKLELATHLAGDLGGTLQATGLKLQFGGSDLAGTAALDSTGARPRLTADLQSTRIDLAEALRAPQAAAPTAAPAAPPTPAPPRRLFSDDKLDLAMLRAVDADVVLRVATFDNAPMPVEAATLRLVLQAGDLTLRPFGFTVAGSQVTGHAQLDATGPVPAMVLDVAAPQLDIGKIQALAGGRKLMDAKGDLEVAVRGKGASPRALMGALDGKASLVVGEGTLPEGYVDGLGLGVLRAAVPQVQRLLGSKLNCAVARFDIAGGVATVRQLGMDAGDLSMVGTGAVDLGAETLALDLSPRLKIAGVAGLGGVVVPVQVRGTLLEPKVDASVGRNARGNPLATLGAIVLDPGGTHSNPCTGAADAPATAQPAPAPSQPAPPALPAIPGLPDLGGILRGLGR